MIENDPLENLLPSLIQCFGVIFIGYLAARLSLISKEADALGVYVTKFALPALFFRSMATINFFDVNWMFILAVSLSKMALFVITVILTLLMTRPINFGMAGILSMFISQTNDVALGYPILLSLYPDLAKYIYLFAPAQLVFINPLCFVLLELHDYRVTSSDVMVSGKRRMLVVLKKVMFNPLVFMTVIGSIVNLVLSHKLPIVIDKLLQILGDSFSGVALFYLGMNMVGKVSSITKRGAYILAFLLIGKLIFMPFLTREFVFHLVNLQLSNNETINFTLMGFFYGCLPTAPPVFLISSTFNVVPEIIATGLVFGTFLSGPLMFLTGRIITMIITNKSQYDIILEKTAVSMSTLSIFGCIWVLVIFLLSRRCRSPLHRVTIGYVCFVLLSCLGLVIGRMLMNSSTNKPNASPNVGSYIQFAIFFIGCCGARIWTTFIAMSIYFVKKKGVYYLTSAFPYICLAGLCIPFIVTALILIFSKRQRVTDIDPSFQYGRMQITTSLVVLATSIILTSVFLILQARLHFLKQHNAEESPKRLQEKENIDCNQNKFDDMNDPSSTEMCCSRRSLDVNPINNCNHSPFKGYQPIVSEESNEEFDLSDDQELQISHHIILNILLVVSMGFGFFLCIWRLIKEDVSGIYIELEFLDCVFNFGQGFILWAVFGLDTNLIVVPCKRRLLKIWNSVQDFYIPPEDQLPSNIQQIRTTFTKDHLVKCRTELNSTFKKGFRTYRNVFTGSQLIDWLIKEELAEDRINARIYGRSLLVGQIIEHVYRDRNFIDDSSTLYRFTDKCQNFDTHFMDGRENTLPISSVE